MLDAYHVHTQREIGGQTIITTSNITDNCSDTIERVHTSIEDKKRKHNALYASASWIDEDEYEGYEIEEIE